MMKKTQEHKAIEILDVEPTKITLKPVNNNSKTTDFTLHYNGKPFGLELKNKTTPSGLCTNANNYFLLSINIHTVEASHIKLIEEHIGTLLASKENRKHLKNPDYADMDAKEIATKLTPTICRTNTKKDSFGNVVGYFDSAITCSVPRFMHKGEPMVNTRACKIVDTNNNQVHSSTLVPKTDLLKAYIHVEGVKVDEKKNVAYIVCSLNKVIVDERFSQSIEFGSSEDFVNKSSTMEFDLKKDF